MARYAVALLIVGAATGCTDAVRPDVRTPDLPYTPAPSPQAILVDAGPDLFVALGDSTLTLRAWTPALASPSFQWTRIAGPASLRIARADESSPDIAGLEIGMYTFQVAVRDGIGRVDTDTLSVHVVDAAAVRTLVIPLQRWVCPMGCHAHIGNIDQLRPGGALMRVQIREGGSAAWREVRGVYVDAFVYQLDGRELYVLTMDEPNRTDVRLLWTMP